MAFCTKVEGIPGDDGQPIWCVEMVSWWDHDELRRDPRFGEIRSPGYKDFVAVLTAEEARELHERCKGKGNDWQQEDVSRLGDLPGTAPPQWEVELVEVYEWESGF